MIERLYQIEETMFKKGSRLGGGGGGLLFSRHYGITHKHDLASVLVFHVNHFW